MFSLNDTDRISKPNSFQFHLLFKIIISPPSQLYLSLSLYTRVCVDVHANGLAYRGPYPTPWSHL